MNDKGSLILCGHGEEISCPWSKLPEFRAIFYEYDPYTGNMETDIFKDLSIVYLFFDIKFDKVFTDKGVGYFIEAENEDKLNIVRCDFNNNTFERLYSVYPDGDISNNKLELISLTNNYFALKQYNNPRLEAWCRLYIYDKEKQAKYKLLYPEDDDMRWAHIKYTDIGGRQYVLFIKYERSDLKFENYIHKWGTSGEWFNKFKDEKLFLIPLQDIIDKRNVFLDESYKIAEADENHSLRYCTVIDGCVVYSIEDFKKYDEGQPYENRLFFYDIDKKQTIKSIPYHGQIYVSNKGNVYEKERDRDDNFLRDVIGNNTYELPYPVSPEYFTYCVKTIIGDYILLDTIHGIIIYDHKKDIEIGKYYTEHKERLAEMRFNLFIDYRYFEKEDLLIIY